MAWIKIDHVTPDKPEIIALGEALKIDQDAAFGKCMRLWIWADQQTVSGRDLSVTEMFLDRLVNCAGFFQKLLEIGWLKNKNGRVFISHFDRHNGQTAKNRALTAIRMKRSRYGASVTNSSPEKEKEKEIDQYKNKNYEQGNSSALNVQGTLNGYPLDIHKPPTPKRGRPKKDPFPADSDPMQLATLFAKLHSDWARGAKPADPAMLQKWAGTFDAMIRLDNRTGEQIADMLNAIDLQKPGKTGFLWRENILSPEKLRKRWNEGKLHSFIPEAYHAR